jgi:hypothetical protein
MRRKKLPAPPQPADAPAAIPTDARQADAETPWGPPASPEVQRWNAQLSLPMDALKGLWERCSSIPFRPEHVYNWLATKGVNRYDAERMTVAEVRAMLKAELAANASADGPWSQPDSPKNWGKAFKVSSATICRLFKDGKIRNVKLHSKSYKVHVDDLPK